MRTYEPEVICVEADGKRYPARITGYTHEGKLPQKTGSEPPRMSAKDAGLNLSTIGIDFTGESPVETKSPVAIQEFATTETATGQTEKVGVSADGIDILREKITLRPMLNLLVNYGNGKRGPEWKNVSGVCFKDHVSGSHLIKMGTAVGKRYFDLCEAKPEAKPVEPVKEEKKPAAHKR